MTQITKDPIKKKILSYLNKNNELNQGDIVKMLKLDPQTVTYHIIELKQAGLVENVSKTSLIKINNEKYDEILRIIESD